MFIRSKVTKEIEINTFDVYKTLEDGFSFSDYDKNGDEFYERKNLKKGKMGENTVQLPSLTKFFDYFADLYQGVFLEEKTNIYELCISALKFYTIDQFENREEFNNFNEKIKEVRRHCQNDVLKLLNLINFMYLYGVGKKNQGSLNE